MNPKEIIQHLQLSPHPEGGYYKETYRSNQTMVNDNKQIRNVCTVIYFLLEGKDVSHFHRIKSDESWFFHSGNAIEIYCLNNGNTTKYTLGNDLLNDEIPQLTISAGTWFAAKPKNKESYGLVSCTVAPGFDFADFELAKYNDLISEYNTSDIDIKSLCIE